MTGPLQGTPEVTERPPVLGVLLAYAAIAPIVAGALASLATAASIEVTIIWAGAILCFLAGVRRGLSFRQPGGPTISQVAGMLAEFVAGVGALLSPWRLPALCLLLAGYGAMAILDPLSARRHEAPIWFARLRPGQMLLAIAALGILLVRCVT